MSESIASISDAVRECVSLSEVAQFMSISRPTLYKYMDHYDSGETERVPARVRDFFAFVGRGGRTRAEVRRYLMDAAGIQVVSEGELDVTDGAIYEGVRSAVGETAPKAGVPVWSAGPLPTLCAGDGTRATVVFRDACADPVSTVVRITVPMGDSRVHVADLVPAPGTHYVTVSDIVPQLGCLYTVVQTSRDGSVTESETRPLRMVMG